MKWSGIPTLLISTVDIVKRAQLLNASKAAFFSSIEQGNITSKQILKMSKRCDAERCNKKGHSHSLSKSFHLDARTDFREENVNKQMYSSFSTPRNRRNEADEPHIIIIHHIIAIPLPFRFYRGAKLHKCNIELPVYLCRLL